MELAILSLPQSETMTGKLDARIPEAWARWLVAKYGDMATGIRTLIRDRIAEDLRLLRKASEGESDNPNDQLALPGFTMPAAISYKDGEDVRWIASRKAKWEHIVKTDDLKLESIESATKNRKRWLEVMDYLRPVMEDKPEMTLEEAVRILSEAAS